MGFIAVMTAKLRQAQQDDRKEGAGEDSWASGKWKWAALSGQVAAVGRLTDADKLMVRPAKQDAAGNAARVCDQPIWLGRGWPEARLRPSVRGLSLPDELLRLYRTLANC
jgi:hypothetical protein